MQVQDSQQPGLGQLRPVAQERGNQRGSNTETKQGDKGPGKEPAAEKVGKERPAQEKARGPWRGAVQRAPQGRGGKKGETKNKRRKTKGQWESMPPYPTSMNFGVAVVTASKGQS